MAKDSRPTTQEKTIYKLDHTLHKVWKSPRQQEARLLLLTALWRHQLGAPPDRILRRGGKRCSKQARKIVEAVDLSERKARVSGRHSMRAVAISSRISGHVSVP